MNLRIRTKLAFLSFLVIIGMSACAIEDDRSIPFDAAGKAGATATKVFHASSIFQKHHWNANLVIVGPENSTYRGPLVVRRDQLVTDIAGWVYPDSFKSPKLHKGVRFHVVWKKIKWGREIVFREKTVIADKVTEGIPGGIGILIDGVCLPRGSYVVTVQAMDDDPRFPAPLGTALYVGYRPLTYCE